MLPGEELPEDAPAPEPDFARLLLFDDVLFFAALPDDVLLADPEVLALPLATEPFERLALFETVLWVAPPLVFRGLFVWVDDPVLCDERPVPAPPPDVALPLPLPLPVPAPPDPDCAQAL